MRYVESLFIQRSTPFSQCVPRYRISRQRSDSFDECFRRSIIDQGYGIKFRPERFGGLAAIADHGMPRAIDAIVLVRRLEMPSGYH